VGLPLAAQEPVPPPRAVPAAPKPGIEEPVAAPRPAALSATPKGNQVMISVGSSQRLQMTKDKEGKARVIQSVVNPKENVAYVQPVEGDPTTVVITGRESGITRITLTAADGTQEQYEIVVQFDIEFLRSVLARAVPTANIQLIPGASGVIIIAGNVAHSEDVDIIMRAAQSVVAQPDRIINAMRVGGVVQVQLDCVVAYVSRDELRRMSFDFLDIGNHHNFSSTVGGALINPNLGSALPSVPGVDLPIANVITSPNGAPANFFLGLFNNEQAFFGLLQALRDDSLIKILAQPKLVTMSGRSANLLSGGEQAIPQSAGLGSISVTFEPFGTQLSVLPIVLGNGRIHLEVEPEVSDIDPTVGTSIQGTVVPGRRTERVHTTVEMQDGQTLAIGGLIGNRVTAHTSKVPILGDLPFLGAAFSSKIFEEREEELLVLITPHLVDAMACNQVPKLLPTQETRSPDDFELFLEGILEAPRGQREVCQGGNGQGDGQGVYVPAYKNGPTAGVYPCGLNNNGCGMNGCGVNGNGCSGGMNGCGVNGNGCSSGMNGCAINGNGCGTCGEAGGVSSEYPIGPGGYSPEATGPHPGTVTGMREGKPFVLPQALGSGGADGGR
jgi:pilus assembly protein CpaC